MKKKIFSVLTVMSMAASMAVSAEAGQTPKIIVDERELSFADQGPVIVEETSRTLIPLRFVLESAGARVNWNQDTQTVTVDSGDNRNRVVLTIGSDEMKMYYYPSVKDYVEDVQKLDQAPVIMNDRTMIPVRAVLEAIGADVEWDEENYIINVTSRAYTRYLRDMGVEGYEVNYPLSDGKATFDQPKERETDEAYEAKKDLPAISISADKTEAAKGEAFEVYVNMSNIDKVDAAALLTTMTVTLKYDSDKIIYSGYALLDGDNKEYTSVMDAFNPAFLNDSVKIVSITNLGLEESEPTKDGAIAKIVFQSQTDEAAEISLSARCHASFGMDTAVSFKAGDKSVSLDDANELYIDTTPVVINQGK